MSEDESISEEQSNKNDQSSDEVNENISQKQPIVSIQASTANPQLSIENIEVHHQYLRVTVQHRNGLKRLYVKAAKQLEYFKNEYHLE
jgi:hypothetical protein